jgi:hypothetical protein
VKAPERPEEIPTYIVDGLERQDPETLREIATYAELLARHREREISRDELEDAVGEGEELESVQEESDGKGVVVKKRIPCGKDCNGCPHGPYEYRAYREGDQVKTEYLGKA